MGDESQWRIVLAQRGWIYAGRVTREGDEYVIRDGYVVRRWQIASKGGLGRLAELGPVEGDEIMDRCTRPIRLHILSLAAGTMDCNDDAWNAWHDQQAAASTKKAKK